jgi:RHS repeat-associated protein
MSKLGFRRQVASVLLYTFGIDAASASSLIGVRTAATFIAVEALAASAYSQSSQTPVACDAALSNKQAPTSSVATSQLWPANHSWQDVGYAASLGSACDGVAALKVQVWSDEPEESQTGDGNQSPDATTVPVQRLQLRAERKGDSDGRVYLTIARATSPSGVTNTSCSVVGVPKSQSKKDLNGLEAQMTAAALYCDAHDIQPPAFFPLLDIPWGVAAVNHAPQASAGPDLSIAYGGTATLNGIASDDGLPGGGLTLHWSTLSGPGTATFANATQSTTSVTFSTSGVYVLRFTANDGALQSSDDVSVTIGPQNLPPVANAGPDASLTLPTNTAILAGSVSDDGQPNGTLTSLWIQLSGPSPAVFGATDAAPTPVTVSVAGVYVFRLTASDGALSAADDMTLTVQAAPNAAPVADAGLDVEVQQPANSGTLQGSASDDGQPSQGLTVAWTQVSGAGTVAFGDPQSLTTTFAVVTPGVYVLRLTVSDGQLSASDDVTLTVLVEAPPVVSVDDLSVIEGNDGRRAVLTTARLSRASTTQVDVDYATSPGSAAAGCDYETAFGTLRFPAGVTALPITVFVNGDLSVEEDEAFEIHLGNPVGATISDSIGMVTLADDDAQNLAPAPPSNRTPVQGAIEQPSSTTLRWTGSPDPEGAAVSYDVQLSASFAMSGQRWTAACAATAQPPARTAPASAYDDATDRMFVFGGSTGSVDLADLWVLHNATMAGGAPTWQQVDAPGGPEPRHHARAVFDPTTDRFIVIGGCTGLCDAPSAQVWALVNASSSSPTWQQLQGLPAGRAAPAVAFDEPTGRVFAFGGRGVSGPTNGAWLMDLRSASPQWAVIPTGGSTPSSREDATAIYDAASDRLIVHGGRTASAATGSLYVLQGASTGSAVWSVAPAVGPVPAGRYGHSLIYDPFTDRAVLFGGTTFGVESDSNFVANDAWVLSGIRSETPAWDRLQAVDPPAGRFDAASAYSAAENRFVTAFGSNNKIGVVALSDAAVLEDANGRLDTVSVAQSATEVAPGLVVDETYYWRVIARDGMGARRGTRAFVFSTGLPSLRVEGSTITEGNTGSHSLAFRVTLSRPSADEVSVDLNIGSGTATAGTDFTSGAARLTFAPGETVRVLNAAVTSDLEPEADETLQAVLSNPVGASISVGLALGVILNDDVANAPPQVTAGAGQTLSWTPLPRTGRVVVNYDEWTLSDNAFYAGTIAYIRNIARWFSPSRPGNFLALSVNFGLTGAGLANTIRGDGHTWTVNAAAPMVLQSLSQYDGIFLTSDRAFDPVILAYVQQGGNVYLAGGTGVGGSAAEAARWNPFLAPFSLRFGPEYIGGGFITNSSSHPVLLGVGELFGLGGNPVFLTSSPDPRTLLLTSIADGGLIGVFDGRQPGFGSVSASLAGTVVDDGLPPPATTSVLWTQISGPAPAIIAAPTTPGTSVLIRALGTYVFRLTATDGALTASSDTTITVVENLPPIVHAGPDQSIELPASTVSLAGSTSDDGQPGTPIQYSWVKLAGPGDATFANAASATTTVELSVAGTYVLRLTASDGASSSSDDIRVTLRDPLNQPPAVVVGPSDPVLSKTVPLTATVTDDGRPFGGLISGSWAVETIPLGSIVSIANPGFLSTSATVSRDGQYVFRSSVSDGELSTETILTVTVDSRNRAPVVNAGSDQAISVSQTTLSSTFIDDEKPEGNTPSTEWSQVSGPALATIASPFEASTGVSVPAAGVYVFQATVSDGELSGTAFVTVTVTQPNDPPAVSAGPDQSLAASTTTLSGSYSDDGRPVGGSSRVLWSQLTGPTAALIDSPGSLATNVTLPAEGDYIFRLEGSDGILNAFDDVLVTRLTGGAGNLPPVVNAGPDRAITALTTQLVATYTDDGLPAGGPVQYSWAQTSGPSLASIATPSQLTTGVDFTTSGTFGFRLQATDGQLVGADHVSIVVTIPVNPPPPLNNPPAVSAGPDQSIALPVLSAILQGTVTDDGLPSGSNTSAHWSQSVGPPGVLFQNSASPTTPVTFPTSGSYVLRLTGTDGQATAFDEVVVNVIPASAIGSAPQITITSPPAGASLSSPTDFIGTIASAQLLDWRLEIKERGETSYRTIAGGNSQITNGVIATFDPTSILNGLYDLQFMARDTALRTTTVSHTAVAEGNLKVGQFSVSFVDLDVPVAGLPLRVTRTYDSRDKAKGDFGYGWRLDLSNVKLRENGQVATSFSGTVASGFFPSYCVQLSSPQSVTVTLPGGDVLEFVPTLTPSCQMFAPISVATLTYVPKPGTKTQGTLVPVGGGGVLVAGTTGPIQLFDEDTFDFYDPDEYLLTLPDGRELRVHQTSGLKRIKDLNGNTLTVTSNGITHSSGRGVSFVRDTEGRITSATDPMGNVQTYGYDAAGDLTTHTDRENNATTFTYLAIPAHHLETITDPLGRTPIRNEYYPDGRIQRHTDAYGKTIEYAHDVTGRQEVVTDREGNVRVLFYDARGNVTKEVHPDGKQTLRTFDARDNRTSETEPHDPLNLTPPTTSWTYDAADNVTSTTDPLQHTTSQTYNAKRQVLTSTDARGKITTNVYDVKGNLTSTTDADGHVSTFTYDANGNLLTQSQTVNGVVETTTNTYDGFGNLLTETDATGKVTTQTYNAAGNRTTETRARTLPGGGTETLTTTYAYDKNGRLLKVTDPDGTFTETVYDAAGRQATTKDKLGRSTTFEYDFMGRVTKTTHPDTTYEASTYDAEGRRLTSRDRAGRITTSAYDALGRLTRTTYPDTTFTENVYDAAGRLTSTKDARGKITTYEYDTAGRRTKVIDPLSHVTEFTYDGNGNQLTVKDANNHTTTYEYDDLNRRTKTTFPDSTFTQTTYDEAGRRTSERDQAGKVTQFRYDKLGRLVKVIDALNQETTYTYDELGNRLTQKDANNHVTSFEYDRLGRETARVLPDNARETKSYDNLGNLASRTDFLGRVTNYGYDINNRLTSRTAVCSSCEKADATWTYTPTGRRETATYSLGASSVTETYGYDNRDRLSSKTMPGGALTYTYDANSNRVTMTSTVGGTTTTATYAYDDASRLDTVTDTLGRVYDLGYDNAGNRTSLVHPNGVATTYGYNTLNRLTTLATQKAATTIQSYAFTLGPTGNRTQIAEVGKTKTYTYDDLYRLTGETLSGSTVYSKVFGYDPVGNRQAQTTTGTAGAIVTPGTINYGYDTRDRLLTENATNYGYDANGNLTTQSGFGTYTFDTENRLVRIAKQDGTVIEHAYDADGTRIRTKTTPATGPPQITNFLVDTSGGLSHVVAESDATGVQMAYYLRALDDLLAVIRPTASPGVFTTRHYHADGIGSIRKLTDETGAVTDSYEYTAFGEQYEHVGTDPQPYAFAGEPLDPNTGFQYHRARWMQPSTGRFAGMDPWREDMFDPSTLHRHLYVGNDPASMGDPTGAFEGLIGLSVASSFQSTLAGIQSSVGFAVMDQILYGGNSGFDSLLLGAAFSGGAYLMGKLVGRFTKWLLTAPPAAAKAQGGRVESQLSRFWNRTTEFQGNRVYQRDDLIDIGRVDGLGRSNLTRMKRGLAPIGPDGKSINLHHMLQIHTGPIAEVTASFHQGYYTVIHVNPNTVPSGIDRRVFDAWRRDYWARRALDFQ